MEYTVFDFWCNLHLYSNETGQSEDSFNYKMDGEESPVECIDEEKTIVPINKGKCQLLIRYIKSTNNLNDTINSRKKTENEIMSNPMLLCDIGEPLSAGSYVGKWLKELISIHEPFSIIVKIEKNKIEFEELLKSHPPVKDIFAIFGVFKTLYSSSFIKHLIAILSKTLVSDFIGHLEETIRGMNENYLVENTEMTEEFMDSLTKYFEYTKELVPVSLEKSFKNLMLTTGECLDKVISMVNQTGNNWTYLKNLRTRVLEIIDSLNNLIGSEDSFKTDPLTVYPINFMKRSYVEKNIVTGPYKDVKHYLETHFRLLKEDFEESLRAGVKLYKEKQIHNLDGIRNTEVDAYENVTLSVSTNPRKNGHLVYFQEQGRFSGVRWDVSRLFKHGSLVVLSYDNFKRCYLALVIDRKGLEKGGSFIQIIFIDTPPSCSKYRPFTLLECTNFFEPYNQVLSALLNMPHKDFPMHKYIISADTSSKLPAYINQNVVYEICGKQIKICDKNSWPQPHQLNLNESQMNALRIALTSEFSLIQGPPGTGKTYVCLKIIETLLKNVNFPILVVCYKNHALDQILGALIKNDIKVLRLGGQSKITDLRDKYNLKTVAKKRISGIKSLLRELSKLHNSMTTLQRKIIDCYNFMSILEGCTGIVQPSLLAKILPEEHLAQINTNFLQWLLNDIPKEINIEVIVNLITQHKEEIRKGHLSVVNNPPEPKNGIDFEILKECNKFQQVEPISRTAAPDVYYKLSLYDLETTMKVIRESIYFHCNNDYGNGGLAKIVDLLGVFNACLTVYLKLKERMKTKSLNKLIINLKTTKNLNSLNTDQRWQLYTIWKNELYGYYERRANNLQKEHNQTKIMFEELNDMKKVKKIEEYGAKVIGATTTGAARCQRLLTELKPKIVIIEEAAEVLEAHAVVALSSYCQHVILIGDHKQLRPCPASYRLATDYHLDISLFERMIQNGLETPILTLQHRMRPEISSLITPSIYSTLYNSVSVCKFPNVMGIDKNMYFINHKIPEDSVVSSLSKMNKFEGDLLLNLCLYLIDQGYKAEEITILATYMAQKDYILSESRKKGIPKEVNITVVDNFQGEENRIILLSLVRCNLGGNIGFLSVENRVCVALSRAKEGLYIIGNMASLVARSKLWTQINAVLINNESIGESLPLRCKTHSRLTLVSSAGDLYDVLKNGCGLVCNVQLSCKHICREMCHSLDYEHVEKFRCKEECTRRCEKGHRCQEICGDDCPPCPEPVEFELDCGHFVSVDCYQTTEKSKNKDTNLVDECTKALQALTLFNTEDYSLEDDISLPNCDEPCNKLLKCGHTCKRKCHVDNDPDHLNYKCESKCNLKNASCPLGHICTRKCHETCGECMHPCKKQLPCGHIVKTNCSSNIPKCEQKCKKTLSCGHSCKGKCAEPCGKCEVMVEKVIEGCGHKVMTKCCEPVNSKYCNNKCDRLLSCGHNCKGICSNQCDSSNCKEPILITLVTCGHKCEVPCHVVRQKGEMNWKDIFACNCSKACNTRLGCGHICTGTCGECVQGRLHKKCTHKCSLKLLCGHKCQASCTDDIHVCNLRCQIKCRHGKCQGSCSVPCGKKCAIKCGRKCSHFQCKKKCHESCEQKCLKDCPLKLACGHACRGYCGYKCPPRCLECGTVTSNDNEHTRYVVLEDCGHVKSIKPSYNNNKMIDSMPQKIGVDTCPTCKIPIITTLFYKEQTAITFEYLISIKNYLTKRADFSEVKADLNDMLHLLEKEINSSDFAKMRDIVNFIMKTVIPFIVSTSKNEKTVTLKSLFFTTKYVIILQQVLKNFEEKLLPKMEKKIFESRVNLIVTKLKERAINLSEEQMLQFKIELMKLITIVDTYKQIIEKITYNKNKTFKELKANLNFNDDFSDTIYSKLKVQQKMNTLEMKAIVSSLEEFKFSFKLPTIFSMKAMHFGDWLMCKNKKHLYNARHYECPSCIAERKNRNTTS